jgi:hypothetical protein
MDAARRAVADGAPPQDFPFWGIQGPGLVARRDWEHEFSLGHFLFLWDEAGKRRPEPLPRLVVRYPVLAGGRPDLLPGIDELERLVEDGAAVVATGDLFHHGIGYGDAPDEAHAPGAGGLRIARERIEEGLRHLKARDHRAYQAHSVRSKSDARDVGQVLAHLQGALEGQILDLVWEDMSEAYGAPRPTWVAGALIDLRRA